MFMIPPCYNVGDTIYFAFDTYGKTNGESVTITGLAISDIEIYRLSDDTLRSSDNGYTLLDTDGIDYKGHVGIQGFKANTSDNSHDGFWLDGSTYLVIVDAVTIDGETVRFSYTLPLGLSLRPTVPGRTLDVTAGGAASLNWAGIENPGAAVSLSDTSIDIVGTAEDSHVTEWAGEVVTVNLSDVPEVAVKHWKETAPLALSSQRVQVDVQAIEGFTAAAMVLGWWLAEGMAPVADSGTTTTLVDATLTQADGYWDGALLVFRSGTNKGRTAIITDFDAGTDTLTFTPPLPDAVTTEGYVLVPGLGLSDVKAISGTAQRATDLAEIAQHLIANSAEPITDYVANDSLLAKMLAADGDISAYDDQVHSQEAIAVNVEQVKTDVGNVWSVGGRALSTPNDYKATGFSTHNAAAVKTAIEAGGSYLALIKAVTDAQTANGSGLSAIPWNSSWDTEVQSECDDALIALNLDHFLKQPVADNADMTVEVVDGTVCSNMMSKASDTSTFSVADDSLQGISEGAAGGGATAQQVWEYATRTLTAGGGAPTVEQIAAAILKTPANLLLTTGDGYVVAMFSDGTPVSYSFSGTYYCARSDVEDVFGSINVATWANLNNNEEDADAVIATRIARAISWSTTEINDRLRGGRYEIPLPTSASATIVDLAATLAGIWLYRSRGIDDEEGDGDKFKWHWDRCETTLSEIRAGKRRLDATSSQTGGGQAPFAG